MSNITLHETEKYVIPCADYFGNLYLKYGDTYYYIFLDIDGDTGIDLVRIENIGRLKKLFNDNMHIKSSLVAGEINAGHTTLRGRVNDELKKMTDEEIGDFTDTHEFIVKDPQFVEQGHYWVKYSDQDEEEHLGDMKFYLNGLTTSPTVPGILLENILTETEGTYDVILIDGDIDGRHIISTIEQRDGACTSRLSISTSGILRANFFDKVKYSRLILDTKNDVLATTKLVRS